MSPIRRRLATAFIAAFVLAVLWTLVAVVVSRPKFLKAKAREYISAAAGSAARVGAVHLSVFDKLELTDLVVADPNDAAGTLMSAASIVVSPRGKALALGSWQPGVVEIDGARLHLKVHTEDGKTVWNFEELPILSGARVGDDTAQWPDRFAVTNATVIIERTDPEARRTITLDKCSMVITKRSKRSLKLVLRASEEHFGPAALTAWVDLLPGGGISVDARMELEKPIGLSEATRHFLPVESQPVWDSISPQGDILVSSVALSMRTGAPEPVRFHTTIRLDGLAIRSPNMPYPATDVRGELRVDNTGVEMRNVTGRFESAVGETFSMSGKIAIDGSRLRYENFLFRCNDFNLGRQIRPFFVPESHDLWHHARVTASSYGKNTVRIVDWFNPVGPMDVEVALEGPVESPHERTTLDLKGIDFCDLDFPYQLSEMTGRIVIATERIDFIGVEGVHGNGTIRAEGQVTNLDKLPHFDISITGRNIEIDRDLRDALDLDGQKVFDDLRPSGSFDVFGSIVGPLGSVRDEYIVHPIRTQFQTTEGLALRNIRGTLVFNPEGVQLKPLTGSILGSPFEFNGSITGSGESTLVDIRGSVHDLDLTNPELARALAVSAGELWEHARNIAGSGASRLQRAFRTLGLLGRARVDVALGGRFHDPKQTYVLHLDDVSVCYAYLPYTLEHMTGTIKVMPEEVIFDNLRAIHGSSSFRIGGPEGRPGRIVTSPGKSRFDLVITGKDVALDKDLATALGPGIADFWRKVSAKGRFDVDCRLTGGTDLPDLEIRVTCSGDQSLDLDELGIGFDTMTLTLTRQGGRTQFGFAGTREPLVVTVENGLVKGLGGPDQLSFSAIAESLPVSQRLIELMGDDVKDLAAKLSVAAGTADVILDVPGSTELRIDRATSSGKTTSETLTYDVAVRLNGLDVTDKRFPYQLRNVSAKLDTTGSRVEIELSGTDPAMQVDIQINGKDDGGQEARLVVDEFVLPLDERFLNAWPEKIAAMLRKLDVRGKLKLRIQPGTLAWNDKTLESGLTGRIDFTDLAARPGVKLSECAGEIRFDANLSSTRDEGDFSKTAEIIGDLVSAGARVDDKPLYDVAGRLKFTARDNSSGKGIEELQLEMRNLSSRLYGGKASGSARLVLAPEFSFGADVRLEGLSLAGFARDFLGYTGKGLLGSLSGELRLQAVNSLDNLVGTARLEVTDGQLWELPLLLHVVDLLNLSLPERHAFRQAFVETRLIRGKMYVDRLDFIGSSVDLYGKGTIDGKQLRLRFSAALGKGGLLQVPVLSNILRRFQRELVQVSVTGELAEPVATLEPLPALVGPIIGDGAPSTTRSWWNR